MNFRFPSKLNVDLKPGRRTLFALALIGVITGSVFSYWNATRLIADEQLVTATHILVASLNTVSAAIKDIEPHVNRYATTSYSRTGALKMVETDLIVQVQDMAQLATISPDQWERVAALQQSIKSYFADLNTVARLNNNGTNFDQVLDEQQIQLSLIADKTVGEMIAEANLFLIQHETMSSATEQTTLTTLMLISAGSVLLFCVIFYSLNREVAKRQHMAAALTDNEQRLRTQYKSLPIPTYTWRKTDNEFVLVDHNDAAIEATQGHIGEWLGNKVHEMYSDMPSLVAMVERCYDEQKVIRWESQYRLRTTGATRDLDFTYVFVAPDSVMIHAEDITDRKRAQEAVAREHNLLRAVIDNLPDYIFAKDKNGYFTLTNIAHAQATNVTPAEMVGKTAYELFPQQMAEQFSLDDEATLQSGQALINVERETRDAEGNKRTVLTSKVPLRDAQNNVIGLIGISRDITELKKTQEALRASEERAGSIVAALSEAIVLRYVDGALQFMNPSAEQLMGTLVRDEEARPYFYDEYENILGDEHRPTAIALSIGKPQRDMLMRVKRLDGEMRWMSVSAQPLFRGGTDVPYATLASFSDITERMRLEEALSEALDQALEASRAKSTFLATMSHEIRTPMNGVIGMTDLVLDTPLSDEQRDMIEIIRTSANALLTIINDILDFSKIEAGKLTLESVDFQPITLVEGAADIIAPKAHEKKLSLMTFVDPAIPPILNGDIVRLQQILINLMGNAVKFTDRGEVVVRAILDERNASSATVRFSVSDSGIGLSESVRQRLFQPFMQAQGWGWQFAHAW